MFALSLVWLGMGVGFLLLRRDRWYRLAHPFSDREHYGQAGLARFFQQLYVGGIIGLLISGGYYFYDRVIT